MLASAHDATNKMISYLFEELFQPFWITNYDFHRTLFTSSGGYKMIYDVNKLMASGYSGCLFRILTS